MGLLLGSIDIMEHGRRVQIKHAHLLPSFHVLCKLDLAHATSTYGLPKSPLPRWSSDCRPTLRLHGGR